MRPSTRASLSLALVWASIVGCSSSPSDPAATADSSAKGATGSAAPASTAAPPTASAVAAAPAPEPSPVTSISASVPGSAAPSAAASAPRAHEPAHPAPIGSASAAPSAAAAPAGPVAGKPWQLVASADADPGYHCNSDYPNKLTTTGGTNVTFPDPKPRGSCVGNRVVVNVPIVPTAAGPGTVVGTLSYGICDDAKTSCLMRKKDVTLSFVAAP